MNRKKTRRKKRASSRKKLAKGVCIECGKPGKGHAVLDDYVIDGIRWVKRKLNIEKKNALIVCEECFEKYEKRRKSFERSLIIYSGVGVLLGVLLLVINPSLGSLLSASILLLFLLILAHLKYAPKVKK